ncbi:hypothetical protein NN561_010872 [Cricetulus griseus]
MRQVSFAAVGASHLHSSIREALGPSWSASFSSQGSDRFTEQLWRKCPFPAPILTWCRQPGGSVLSPLQRVPEDAGWKSKKATLSRVTQANGDKQHSRPL